MLKKLIAGVAICVALIVFWGVIGSYDAETITFAQCATISGICFAVECVALKILNTEKGV